jgi:hypothetical protein
MPLVGPNLRALGDTPSASRLAYWHLVGEGSEGSWDGGTYLVGIADTSASSSADIHRQSYV